MRYDRRARVHCHEASLHFQTMITALPNTIINCRATHCPLNWLRKINLKKQPTPQNGKQNLKSLRSSESTPQIAISALPEIQLLYRHGRLFKDSLKVSSLNQSSFLVWVFFAFCFLFVFETFKSALRYPILREGRIWKVTNGCIPFLQKFLQVTEVSV